MGLSTLKFSREYTMPDTIPDFDNEKIARIIKERYGLEGEISSLNSFEDQNTLIKTETEKFVLKIANKRMRHEYMQMQTDILNHLRDTAPELTIPRVIKTLNGEENILEEDFPVRLLIFLEGDILGDVKRSPARMALT